MNIDYSDIQPGDDAPDSEKPPRARAAEPAHAPTHHTGQHAALNSAALAAQQAGEPATKPNCANVVVLSADPTLIDLLRDSLAGVHRVWRADDATHAADLMVASGNAVLLIDASLADHNTKDLVNQVHKQFPDLAIIVAGRRDDEHELAPLVSEGIIFRFLHKPASAERIRHFVDSTQRRSNGTGLTATMPPRHKNQLFGGTSELPILSPIKLKLDEGFTRRWGRRSLLLIPVALIAWGIAEWEPWNRVGTDSPGQSGEQVASRRAPPKPSAFRRCSTPLGSRFPRARSSSRRNRMRSSFTALFSRAIQATTSRAAASTASPRSSSSRPSAR